MTIPYDSEFPHSSVRLKMTNTWPPSSWWTRRQAILKWSRSDNGGSVDFGLAAALWTRAFVISIFVNRPRTTCTEQGWVWGYTRAIYSHTIAIYSHLYPTITVGNWSYIAYHVGGPIHEPNNVECAAIALFQQATEWNPHLHDMFTQMDLVKNGYFLRRIPGNRAEKSQFVPHLPGEGC